MENESITCHMTNEKRLIDANALTEGMKSRNWFCGQFGIGTLES